MSATEPDTDAMPRAAGAKKAEWNWHPELPIENSPLFAWPPDPARMRRRRRQKHGPV